MSCYAWEHGTITLPSGQAPVLRRLLTEAAEARITTLGVEAEKGSDSLKSLTPAKRRELRLWHHDSLLGNLDEEAVWLLQRYGDKTRATQWARPT